MDRHATIWHESPNLRILQGDVLAGLHQLPPSSVHCVVTSPPYWGLRDYGVEGQWGREPHVEDYLTRVRAVLSQLDRVLVPGGAVWINLDDSYAGSWGNYVAAGSVSPTAGNVVRARRYGTARPPQSRAQSRARPKSLLGVPWRVMFAALEDGWDLSRVVVWVKPNAMPNNAADRLNRRYEWVFRLTHRGHAGQQHKPRSGQPLTAGRSRLGQDMAWIDDDAWTIPGSRYRSPHAAVGPIELARRCIALDSRPGDVVLDPFTGTGTTLLAARELGRRAVGIELSPDSCAEAAQRLTAGVHQPAARA